MSTIKIGLLGLGTVGTGVWKVLNTNSKEITERSGYEVKVSKILVRDVNKDRGINVPKELLTTDFNDILNDDSIDIVVEVIGGIDPAKDFIIKSMKRKKHVVTANKMLIAKHGNELFKAAEEENVNLYFEASVGGGIPIIRSINESLTADKIENMAGILNGTTNYILTRMAKDNIDYKFALRDAQDLGYAEADPTSDVEGYDSVYKLSILSSLAFNERMDPASIYREGITGVEAVDIEYAEKMGYAIKLLAIAKDHKNNLELRVHPALVPAEHPIAGVNDAFNSIMVKGNTVGELMFYGKGAGDLPTGSSVVGDIISILRGKNGTPKPRGGRSSGKKNVLPIDEIETSYYLRLNVGDFTIRTDKIKYILEENNINTDNVIYDESLNRGIVVLTTGRCRESDFKRALGEIKGIDNSIKVGNMIRIEKFQ